MEELDKILDKQAKDKMLEWDLDSFKTSHLRLYKTIISAMEECNKNKEITTTDALNDALTREANYSVQYADYSKDTWTVASKITERRIFNILDDGSITKVRIEFDL